jgi:hypothetical protein
VRNQGSKVSGQSVEQSLAGHAATSVSGDEGCIVAATRRSQPQLSRQPVDFKHERGVWLIKQPFVETPNGATPNSPIRQAGTAPPFAYYDGLVRVLRKKMHLRHGLPPHSGAAPVLQLVAPPTRHTRGPSRIP